MNPEDRKSNGGTPYSASDIAGMGTDELPRLAAEEGFTQLQEQALKSLVRFLIRIVFLRKR